MFPFCADKGLRRIGASVMAHNKGAIAFYESIGFRVCGYNRRIVDWYGEFLKPSRSRCGCPMKNG